MTTPIAIPTEYERKFLIKPKVLKDLLGGRTGVHIKQGYLFDQSPTVRVRIAGNAAFLTIKGKAKDSGKPEFEYLIPVDHAQHMLDNMCGDRIIYKVRHSIPLNGRDYEVDVFQGKLEGMVVAELEFLKDDPIRDQDLPSWVRREVTDDKRYKNKKLAISQVIPEGYSK